MNGSRPVVGPYGNRALLLEFGDRATRADWDAFLTDAPPPGVAEVVPAALTVLLVLHPGADPRRVATSLTTLDPPVRPADHPTRGRPTRGRPTRGRPTRGRPLELAVRYDGDDLATVAASLDMTTADLIAWHTGRTWRVDFTGFLPGFGYLITDDPLDVPRRATPRTRVPAGSVALAGPWSAIYPGASPGGWQLIGTCGEPVWDVRCDPPALLTARREVRFVAVDRLPDLPADGPTRAGQMSVRSPALEVIDPGLLTVIEDAGRPGKLRWGVAAGGAADHASLALANRLVGNDPAGDKDSTPSGSAGLECLLAGLVLRALADVTVAVTGAPAPVSIDDRPAASFRPLRLRTGQVLRLGRAVAGLRTYVAIAGGIDGPVVLGARSSSPSLNVGPAAVRPGDQLALAGPAGWPPDPALAEGRAATARVVTVPVHPGPRRDWLTPKARTQLVSVPWVVSDRVDRVGVRLIGPSLERAVTRELVSEPLLPGAVQVPPDGQPVVFGVDHPTTGGYPVPVVVDAAGLDLVAQLRPGDVLRFDPRS